MAELGQLDLPVETSGTTMTACCASCLRTDVPLLRCTRCQAVQYCGVACQRSNWNAHNGFCIEMGTILSRSPAPFVTGDASDSSFEVLYPQGIHYSIWEENIKDPMRILAFSFRVLSGMNEEWRNGRDGVDSAGLDDSDPRVGFVATCGHGFLVLARPMRMDGVLYPAGTIVGDEDCGLGREWKHTLGWASSYTMDGDASSDEDEG